MNANRTIFITATDTGVGKTLVSGLLLRFLAGKGIDCAYQKWTSSGGGDQTPDLAACLGTAGIEARPDPLELQVPYRFELAASPHLAAEQEGCEVDPARITEAFREMRSRHDFLVIEGVGGLLVPLRRDLLLADLLAELSPPVLVVARSGLGTLNHTLLTLESLRSRNIPLVGVLMTDGENENELLAADNVRTIGETAGVKVFGRLPFRHDTEELHESFAPIGESILNELDRQGGQ